MFWEVSGGVLSITTLGVMLSWGMHESFGGKYWIFYPPKESEATTSMSAVCGNMSTGTTVSSR
jgi:hypothetical protein